MDELEEIRKKFQTDPKTRVLIATSVMNEGIDCTAATGVIDFTIPTPQNNSVLKQDYIYINASITDEHSIMACILEFNGINETISFGIETA